MKNLVQQLTEELTAQTKRAQALQQIVDELFTIAAPGTVKKALWARYQNIEGASQEASEVITEQAGAYRAMESALQVLTGNILNLRTELLVIKGLVAKESEN